MSEHKCEHCGQKLPVPKYKIGDEVWIKGIIEEVDPEDLRNTYYVSFQGDDGAWIGDEDIGESDEWIKWSGGDCPVAGYWKVEIKLRDGCSTTAYAQSLRWIHVGNDADIVAYRISGE
jgi:hypothetical protein